MISCRTGRDQGGLVTKIVSSVGDLVTGDARVVLGQVVRAEEMPALVKSNNSPPPQHGSM
jgi:hypothetical protein